MDSMEAAKRGLGGGEKKHTHTHRMTIERGATGGHVVHVHKHFGKGPHSEGMSHETGPHAVKDNEALQDMIKEHMGDQPAAGEMPEEAQNPAEQGDGTAAAGEQAPPQTAGM